MAGEAEASEIEGQSEEKPQPLGEESRGEGAFWSVADVLRDMEENPEPPEEVEGVEDPAATTAETKPNEAEEKPETEPKASDELESERLAREESEAYQLQEQLREREEELEQLRGQHTEAERAAQLLRRLQAGEPITKLLPEYGLNWNDLVAGAIRDPATSEAERKQQTIEQQLTQTQEMVKQLLQDQGRDRDIRFASTTLREHADRWPELSKHPQGAEAVVTEYYAKGDRSVSFEKLADELERALTEEREQSEWKSSPEYQAWKAQRTKGTAQKAPGGATPRAAETKPRRETESSPNVSPHDAAGKEEDEWAYLERRLGRTPTEKEVMLLITRGVDVSA